jgi:hypothetical protein
MSYRGLITLPPTHGDLVVSRACARGVERVLQVVTWLADEKVVLGAAMLFWTYARISRRKNEIARRADHMLCCIALRACCRIYSNGWSTANVPTVSWSMTDATGYRAQAMPGARKAAYFNF